VEATQAKQKRKVFYSKAPWYFAFGLLVIVIGFYQSYFTQLKQTDIGHHLHGIAALLWMLMLIVQPLTVGGGRIKWHRVIGKFSFVLVPVVILSGLHIVQMMILAKDHYPPPTTVVYQLAFIDLFSLAQFAWFYVMAIRMRKKIQLHARYMAATVFLFIIPGLGRALFFIPGVNSFNKAVNISFVLTELVLLLLMLDDKRSGKIRLPYLLAFILFALQFVGYNVMGQFAWWVHLMDVYAKLQAHV
jgi:hypothetical protein